MLCLAPNSIRAHGDLDERILQVSTEIASKPDNSFLYYSSKSIDRAIQVLYQRINKEGPLLNFYNKKKSIQLEKRDFEGEIQTQLQIIDLSERKEKVYYKLALIYSLSTTSDLAKKYCDKAIIELKKLPPRLQYNKAMKDLESSIHATLKSINELQNSK